MLNTSVLLRTLHHEWLRRATHPFQLLASIDQISLDIPIAFQIYLRTNCYYIQLRLISLRDIIFCGSNQGLYCDDRQSRAFLKSATTFSSQEDAPDKGSRLLSIIKDEN